LPQANYTEETIKPVLMSELKRQFGQKEQDPFYDTNQFDIINIDIVGKSATVKAKEFATLYVPNSEATIK
jgi:hypothetical protein